MYPTAPYFSEIDGTDLATEAFWLTAEDGVRLRFVVWRGGSAGTVVIYSGRTEFAEKYAQVAAALIARDFTVVTLDWRGQGLSDRTASDPMLGHVATFDDYQTDVRATLSALERIGTPQPLFLIGHSLGGCIGLRSLVDGVPFAAAGFSGPMWGILTKGLRAYLAPVVPPLARALGLGLLYTPGTDKTSFLVETAFADNTLSTDTDRYALMQSQAGHAPGLALGGPSMHWITEAFAEMKSLKEAKRPETPTITFLGALEEITDPEAIRSVSANWRSETLVEIDGAKHELMMERDEVRDQVLDGYVDLFLKHRGA